MENTNTPTVKKTHEQIAAAWQKLGANYSALDMKLQAMAQSVIKKIKIPTTIAEIADAEKLVTELRNDYTSIMNERKLLTGKLDAAITHLMEPEKLIVPAIAPLTNAILSLKKQAEAEANKLKYHADEIKSIKESIANHITNHDANCKRKIIDLVDKAYSFALGNGDVKVEEVDTYISRCMKRVGEDEFKISAPVCTRNYTTEIEFNELWENALFGLKEPMVYRDDLYTALKTKFEFYNIAVKNKVESLKQAAEEKAAEENKISKEVKVAETSNALNAISTTTEAVQTTTHKELKKVYMIDMVGENWGNATLVMAAFIANLDKCKEEIRVKNIWNLSIAQMSVALSALKNKDEKFEFGNLKFQLIDKL